MGIRERHVVFVKPSELKRRIFRSWANRKHPNSFSFTAITSDLIKRMTEGSLDNNPRLLTAVAFLAPTKEDRITAIKKLREIQTFQPII